MKRIAILISGGGSNMVRLVETMLAEGYAAPVLVGSNDPAAAGLARARDLGVTTVAVDHKPFGKDRAAFEAELLRPILAAEPDILCLAGFMRVLTPDFVRRFEGRMLNIHPSLLPKYPGLHTHQRALEAGDTEAGCTVHEVTPVLDDGPILGQGRVPVLPDDSAETLAARVLKREHQLYPAVLRRYVRGDRSPVLL
ncbi:phosphoribosylglycinamide formyltransferase [Paenirhodobacter sp.]|uniref:phosphoribosylglycinamide formyltransferase n=1 Tax=Paenirhodobacter sp. TaxID=1965326 RepID=UPI003B50D677